MTVVATTALNPEVEWPETQQDADLIDGDAPPPAPEPSEPDAEAQPETWDDLPGDTENATDGPDTRDAKGQDRPPGA